MRWRCRHGITCRPSLVALVDLPPRFGQMSAEGPAPLSFRPKVVGARHDSTKLHASAKGPSSQRQRSRIWQGTWAVLLAVLGAWGTDDCQPRRGEEILLRPQGLISALALAIQDPLRSRPPPVAAHDPRTSQNRAPRTWIDDAST